MKRRALIFAIAGIVAIAFIAAIAHRLQNRSSPPPTLSVMPAGESLDRYWVQDGPSTAGHTSDPKHVPRAASNPFPEVPRSRDAIQLTDDPFDGRTDAERRWLDKHGYPNTLQWNAYNLASDGLLEQTAQSGDRTAQTLLDARRLPDKEALDRLMLSAVDGNMFALQMVASHYASTGKAGNSNAYAISRVLEMRGDPSAAVSRELMFNPPLELDERMHGEAEALQLNATLNDIYQQKYESHFQPDLRPFPMEPGK